MEDKEADPNATAVVLPSPPPMGKPHPKKKRPGVNPLSVALFMVRRRTSGKNKDPLNVSVVKPGGRGLWKALLAVMRPLHHHPHTPQLQHTDAARPSPLTLPARDARDLFHDVPPAPPSPTASSDSMSRYASADDLRALDVGGSSDDDKEDDGNGDGALTIDQRAEEFIAKFYEQIRLQRLQSINED